MTDPKTAALLQSITKTIRPYGMHVEPELDENGLLEFEFYVKSANGEGRDVFTIHLNLNEAFTLAEKLVLPFARKML